MNTPIAECYGNYDKSYKECLKVCIISSLCKVETRSKRRPPSNFEKKGGGDSRGAQRNTEVEPLSYLIDKLRDQFVICGDNKRTSNMVDVYDLFTKGSLAVKLWMSKDSSDIVVRWPNEAKKIKLESISVADDVVLLISGGLKV